MQLSTRAFFFVLILLNRIIIFIYFINDGYFLPKKESTNTNAFYLKSKCNCKKDQTIQISYDNTYLAVNLIYDSQNKTKKLYNISHEEFQNSNFTCDPYNVFRRGKSQKVIGLSLYGRNKFYYRKLKDITRQLKALYPGWLIRVYYDNSIDPSIICDIECVKDNLNNLIDNTDFCHVETGIRLSPLIIESFKTSFLNVSYIHAMKWRWLPIGDSFVDIFSSRDSDSYLLQREVDSVNVWLKSSKPSHIMRGS